MIFVIYSFCKQFTLKPHVQSSKMNRPQQSIKLKQISRIISRQRDEEVTSSCISIVVILFIIFITGIIMIISGAIFFNDCLHSWLPTWLMVNFKRLSENSSFLPDRGLQSPHFVPCNFLQWQWKCYCSLTLKGRVCCVDIGQHLVQCW